MTYFPFADYWWFYLGFTGFVLLLLALDLGVFHRKAHVVSVPRGEPLERRVDRLWRWYSTSLSTSTPHGSLPGTRGCCRFRASIRSRPRGRWVWSFSPGMSSRRPCRWTTSSCSSSCSRSSRFRRSTSTACCSTESSARWSSGPSSSLWDRRCCSITGSSCCSALF